LKKEAQTCHGCGIESVDDCPKRHIPADANKFPCNCCRRNPDLAGLVEGFRERMQSLKVVKLILIQYPLFTDIGRRLRDRWNERWALNSDGTAILES